MKFSIIFTLLVASAFADDSLLNEFAKGNIQYIGSLYKQVLKEHSENFIVCPLSIQSVFALVNSGAKGNTAKQIATTLHLPESEEDVKKVFTTLAQSLQVNDEYTLTSANKVYLAELFKINEQYKATAVEVFQSDIQNIDFSKPKEAAKEINGWVEEKTHNKIKDLLNEDILGPNTIAVLINALYFQGTWASEFEKVFKAQFRLDNKKSVLTDMMNLYELVNYHYCSELKAKFIELPYKGERVTLTVVLPDDAEGLPALEERAVDVLNNSEYVETLVNITIPKFKIETTTQLIPTLTNMGIVDAFTGAADFSGIGESKEHLTITEVVQKAFIEVDEKGTTAAAATAIFMERSGREYDETVFLADHPFLFYLKHKVNGVFFIGRYVKAKEATADDH